MANYIDNKEFFETIVKYKVEKQKAKENSLPIPKIPNYIGDCFIKIAQGMAKKPNFFAYTYKDEMISDAVENCILYFDNFDPEKSKNPFAYFSQFCYFAFVRRIAKEKKQQYVKYKATEKFGIFLSEEETEELNELGIPQFQVYDNMYDYISKFEQSMNKEKTVSSQQTSKKKGVEYFLENEEFDEGFEQLEQFE